MTNKAYTLSILLSLYGLLTSCSPFQADFAQSVATAKIPPNSPHGPWTGRWKSDLNGHEGPLWCIISPNSDIENATDFRYRAGWGKLQFGDYLHTVTAQKNNPLSILLADEMELPGGFGTYSIKGTVTATTFDATFRAENGDHGSMTLRRPN